MTNVDFPVFVCRVTAGGFWDIISSEALTALCWHISETPRGGYGQDLDLEADGEANE